MSVCLSSRGLFKSAPFAQKPCFGVNKESLCALNTSQSRLLVTSRNSPRSRDWLDDAIFFVSER